MPTKALGILVGLLSCAAAGAQSGRASSAATPADTASMSIGSGLTGRFVDQSNKRLRFGFRRSIELPPGHYVLEVGYVGALKADERSCKLEFDVTSERAYIIVPHLSSGIWGASLRSYEPGHDSREVGDRKFDPLVDLECKFD